jgi:hypothetical protein
VIHIQHTLDSEQDFVEWQPHARDADQIHEDCNLSLLLSDDRSACDISHAIANDC